MPLLSTLKSICVLVEESIGVRVIGAKEGRGGKFWCPI